MPVNAHTHLYSGLAPLGMPAPAREPKSFVEILELVWWKLDRALDEASLRASARYYVAEARRLGCTGLIDHHESPEFIEGSLDVIADACEQLGMPAVLCYGATERNGGRGEAGRGLGECERFLRENQRRYVRGAFGLHASFTVSDETIADAADMARELGAVLHVHVAEAASDVADAKQRGYDGVVDRFAKLDALVPGSIFAHGVHLTDAEVATLDERGIWLVHNPRSNEGNKVGYSGAIAASRLCALGTDGYPADMDEEMANLRRLAEQHDDDSDPLAKLHGSERLLAALFGDAISELAPGEPLSEGSAELQGIRADADTQAAALWARMERL